MGLERSIDYSIENQFYKHLRLSAFICGLFSFNATKSRIKKIPSENWVISLFSTSISINFNILLPINLRFKSKS